jgi:hypothetical protein
MTSLPALAAPATLSEEDKDSLHTRIMHRCIPTEDSSCWIWTGAVSDRGNPRMKVAGRRIEVRRLLAAVYLGLALFGTHRLRMTCRNPCCVNYEHLHVVAPAARKAVRLRAA